ncbi:MAG: thymidylate kinase [bacterium]|nr:thymidylate kinase [bacterium]
MKGKLIVIEGTDCSGKQTQTELLQKKLNEIGINCIRIDFPRYDTPTGRIVGGPYLGKPEICESFFEEGAVNVDPKIASLYYAADRKYSIGKVNEYLEKGYYVILDRYTTSNLAHQGSKILDKDERFNMYQWIDKLEYWLLDLPKPDLTIFLHMPYEYSVELKKNRNNLDEHEKSEQHLKHAEACYIELKELYNWSYVNCIQNNKIKSIEDINNEILEIVLNKKK